MDRMLPAGLATLLLATGCAPVQYTKADVEGQIVCNTDVMERIEREASRRFASLQWVNCPKATLRVI